MRRGLLFSVLHLAGVLLGFGRPESVAPALAGLLLLLPWIRQRRWSGAMPLVWAAFGLTAGIASAAIFVSLRQEAPAWIHPHGSAVPVFATVETFVELAPDSARFVVRADPPSSLRIAVTTHRDAAVGLHPLDRVALHGRISAPPPTCNQDGFDYGRWLDAGEIRAVMAAQSAHKVYAQEPSGQRAQRAHSILVPGPMVAFRSALAGMRDAMRSAILAGHLDSDSEALLIALLLGEQRGVGDETRKLYSRTGTAHVLAVSGLHLACLAAFVFLLGAPLTLLFPKAAAQGRISRARLLLALSVCTVYLVLTGESLACIRAWIMIAGYSIARLLNRDFDVWTWMGISSTAILAGRPAAVFDAGFQLSLSSVGAIACAAAMRRVLWWTEPIHLDLGPPKVAAARKYIGQALLATGAATLGTMPFTWWHFGTIPLASIPANVVAVPVSSLIILPGAMIHGIVLRWIPWVGDASLVLLGHVLFVLNASLDAWAAILPAVRPAWPGWLAASGAAGLLFLAAFGLRSIPWRVGMVLSAAALVCAPVLSAGDGPQVHFFHAGEADAALIRLPCGQDLLVDAGTKGASSRAVEARLVKLGIHHLDAAIISHGHADHWSGLPDMDDPPTIGTLFTNNSPLSIQIAARLASLHPSDRPALETLSAGDELDLCGAAVHVLGPTGPQGKRNDNDFSLVLLLDLGKLQVLLPGDVQSLDSIGFLENDFLDNRDSLGSDHFLVVKAPHHGRRSPALLAVLTALEPDVVLVPSEGLDVWREAFLAFRSPTSLPPFSLISGQDGAFSIGLASRSQLFSCVSGCN